VRAFLGIIIAVLLSGCAAQLQAKRNESILAPYVGKSIADYALDRGPPTNTIDMGANKRGFQWVLRGQSSPFDGSAHCGAIAPANLHNFLRRLDHQAVSGVVGLDNRELSLERRLLI
jgi:hypothetical protein